MILLDDLFQKTTGESAESLVGFFSDSFYNGCLVGGWTNPFEKYAGQNGNLPQSRGENEKYLKPAPSCIINPIGSIYHLHTTYSPCPLGDYMLPTTS